jgi:hypothetical protein
LSYADPKHSARTTLDVLLSALSTALTDPAKRAGKIAAPRVTARLLSL